MLILASVTRALAASGCEAAVEGLYDPSAVAVEYVEDSATSATLGTKRDQVVRAAYERARQRFGKGLPAAAQLDLAARIQSTPHEFALGRGRYVVCGRAVVDSAWLHVVDAGLDALDGGLRGFASKVKSTGRSVNVVGVGVPSGCNPSQLGAAFQARLQGELGNAGVPLGADPVTAQITIDERGAYANLQGAGVQRGFEFNPRLLATEDDIVGARVGPCGIAVVDVEARGTGTLQIGPDTYYLTRGEHITVSPPVGRLPLAFEGHGTDWTFEGDERYQLTARRPGQTLVGASGATMGVTGCALAAYLVAGLLGANSVWRADSLSQAEQRAATRSVFDGLAYAGVGVLTISTVINVTGTPKTVSVREVP